MPRRCLFFVLVFLIPGFAVPVLAAPQWVRIHSDHFIVTTDAGEKQGEQIALRFEQMRAAFEVLFNRARVNMPVPLEIVAFQDHNEFEQYAPRWNGKPINMTGFYQGAPDHDYIGIDLSSHDPFGTACHEYAHQLLHGNFPATPLWFDEGFAEYFSSLAIGNGKMQLGNPPAALEQVLANSQWMPIDQLFGVERDSNVYNEGNKRSAFYAESWLTVNYLMANNRLPDAFQYLHLTQIEHVPVPEAVQRAFGATPQEFEKIVREYLGHEKIYQGAAPSLPRETYRTNKLSGIEAKATLADMHAHSRDYQDRALTEFEAILNQEKGNFVANRGLGYLYMEKGDFDKAAELFRKALVADQNDGRLQYLLALLTNRQALKSGTPPAQPIVMRQELQKAIQLDPDFADAHNLLAFAWGAESNYPEAIREQKIAISLDPGEDKYQANLAHLYLQSQQWDMAQDILQRLEKSQDPDVRQDATRNLAAIETNKQLAEQNARVRQQARQDPTLPQWKGSGNLGESLDDALSSPETKPAELDKRKVSYFQGLLERVDCSAAPVAVLHVKKGARVLRLRTDNYNNLLVAGENTFSCGWRDRNVLVNYKAGGKADGDLVSIELVESR